jgi:hypothetical protein
MIHKELIQTRINELNEKLSLLDEKYQAEMKKQFRDRSHPLLYFIYKEKCVYSFCIGELEKILAN